MVTLSIKEDSMLVLSRKIHEKIVIDGDIILTVVDIIGDRVKLGFNAPHDVTIDRAEVDLAKRQPPRDGNEYNR